VLTAERRQAPKANEALDAQSATFNEAIGVRIACRHVL